MSEDVSIWDTIFSLTTLHVVVSLVLAGLLAFSLSRRKEQLGIYTLWGTLAWEGIYFFDLWYHWIGGHIVVNLFVVGLLVHTLLRRSYVNIAWALPIAGVWNWFFFTIHQEVFGAEFAEFQFDAVAWEEVAELIWDWNFANVSVIIASLLLIGSGIWRVRYKSVAWGVALAMMWGAFHIGLGRHEWGEVFFNGTLL